MQRALPHFGAYVPVVFFCLLMTSSASAERATVSLRNGGQATGEIILHLPNDRITLDLGNGERVTFTDSEIAEIRKEPSTPAAPPVVATTRPPLTPAAPPATDPMNWFGLGLRFGLRGTVNTQTAMLLDLERTPEFNMDVALNLGGDGFGWVVQPGLSVGKAHFKETDLSFARTPDATLVSIALYTGPTLNLHLTRTFYLGLGLGPRGSYGFWKKGVGKANPVEVAARVPVTATLYLASQLALVIELGLGGGYCWWMTENLGGSGKSNVFIADLGVGVRWP